MKYLFIFFIAILIQCEVQAQYDTLYMAVMPFKSSAPAGDKMAKAAQSNAIAVINKDYRILRVDRDDKANNAVVWEREYQKSEDFIDGRIVEQGKSIGADYVIEGYYDARLKALTVSVYNMTNGSLKGSVVAEKSDNISQKKKKKKGTGLLDLLTMKIIYDNSRGEKLLTDKEMKSSVEKLLEKCFPDRGWAVLRPTSENKSKVKELLIAAGGRMGLKKRNLLEILVVNVEEVDGFQLERLESIAWGKIDHIESENFAILEIEAGAKNIKEQLAAGKKLRCRRIKK